MIREKLSIAFDHTVATVATFLWIRLSTLVLLGSVRRILKKKITSINFWNLRFPCRSRTASRRHESNETVSARKILSIYETECAFVISNNKNRGKLTDLARAVALRFTAKTKLKIISINFWIHDFPIDLELLVVDVNQTKQCRLGKFSQFMKRNVFPWYRLTKTEANLPTWPGQLYYNSRQKRK